MRADPFSALAGWTRRFYPAIEDGRAFQRACRARCAIGWVLTRCGRALRDRADTEGPVAVSPGCGRWRSILPPRPISRTRVDANCDPVRNGPVSADHVLSASGWRCRSKCGPVGVSPSMKPRLEETARYYRSGEHEACSFRRGYHYRPRRAPGRLVSLAIGCLAVCCAGRVIRPFSRRRRLIGTPSCSALVPIVTLAGSWQESSSVKLWHRAAPRRPKRRGLSSCSSHSPLGSRQNHFEGIFAARRGPVRALRAGGLRLPDDVAHGRSQRRSVAFPLRQLPIIIWSRIPRRRAIVAHIEPGPHGLVGTDGGWTALRVRLAGSIPEFHHQDRKPAPGGRKVSGEGFGCRSKETSRARVPR